MMEELKPCPCCGHPAQIWEDCDDAGITFYNVGCSNCTVGTDWLYKRDDCISHWNDRQEPDDLIRTVKTRINELEEQIEENCTYRSRELVNHEIVVLKWVLSLRKQEETE